MVNEMFNNNIYKVYLPDVVFENAHTVDEVEDNAKKYLEICYPERVFIEVEGRYALCEMKR